MSLVNDDTALFVYGGFNDTTIFSDCWLFHLKSQKWEKVFEEKKVGAGCYQTACTTDVGDVFMFGGWDEYMCALDTMRYFVI